MRPLTGKAGAALGIKHARLEVKTAPNGDRTTIAEYNFDENELNRAAVNIDEALSGRLDLAEQELPEPASEAILREAVLFFEQASRKPGKDKGRTADRGVVPDVSGKSLPVYFHKSFQSLKDRMIRANPLTDNAFIVDVYVVRDAADEPKAYYITNVHRVVPMGADA